ADFDHRQKDVEPLSDHQPFILYYPVSLKRHSYSAGFRSKPAALARGAVCFVQSGSGFVLLNDRHYPANAGAFFFIRQSTRFQLVVDRGEPLELELLHYRMIRLAATDEYCHYDSVSPRDDRLAGSSPPAVTAPLLARLRQALEASGELGGMRKQHALYELL